MENAIYRLPGLLAAVCLFCLMLLVASDVAGRYFFNHPIGGGYELVQLMMGVIVFSALPLVSRANDHIGIGLLDGWFHASAERIRRVLVNLFSALALAFVGWRLGVQTFKLARNGDATAVLALPLAPIGMFMTVMTFAAVISLLVLSLRSATRAAP